MRTRLSGFRTTSRTHTQSPAGVLLQEWTWPLGASFGYVEKRATLYVVPRVRRKGGGKRLALEAMARLRDLGAPRVVLTSAWQNQDAQALFRSLGFRETMIGMAKELDGG